MPLVSEQPIFTIHSPLGGIQRLGDTPYGERRIMRHPLAAGQGLIRHGLRRAASTGESCAPTAWCVQARYTLEADSGAKILVDAEGYPDGPPEVMERLARDETVEPSLYYFRTFMRFETSDPAASWLDRILDDRHRSPHEGGPCGIEVFEVL